MQTENKNVLEFLVLKIKSKVFNKTGIDAYSKGINSFIYVDPKTCKPSKNKNKIAEGTTLRLNLLILNILTAK